MTTTFNVLELFQRADSIKLWKDDKTLVPIVRKDFQHLAVFNIRAVILENGLHTVAVQIPEQEVELNSDGVVVFKDVGGKSYVALLAILRPMGGRAAQEERIKPWNKDANRSFFEEGKNE